MKARQWQQYLENQSRRHGKVVYTTTELANVAGTSLRALNVELTRLRQYGIIERYSNGIYGLPGRASPEMLLPFVDRCAYISSGYALHYHHLITQVPLTITCFTNRRHGSARVRMTSLGRIEFVTVKRPVYAPPYEGVVAGPEQALFDFVFLMRRRGILPETLVTFRNLDRIRDDRLESLLPAYPRTVGKHVWNSLHVRKRVVARLQVHD